MKDINIIYKTFRNSELEGFPISSVIHLAGLKAVHESIQNPLLYWDNNLIGTINLLKIIDVIGREYKSHKDGIILFYIYLNDLLI